MPIAVNHGWVPPGFEDFMVSDFNYSNRFFDGWDVRLFLHEPDVTLRNLNDKESRESLLGHVEKIMVALEPIYNLVAMHLDVECDEMLTVAVVSLTVVKKKAGL